MLLDAITDRLAMNLARWITNHRSVTPSVLRGAPELIQSVKPPSSDLSKLVHNIDPVTRRESIFSNNFYHEEDSMGRCGFMIKGIQRQ